MNYFLQSASFIFHPLLMPLISVGLYFKLTPKFIEPEIIIIKTYAIIIITILIPLISFFLLKNSGLVKSINLKEVKERKYPLMIQIILIFIIITRVFTKYHHPELYYFFIAVAVSSLAALILVIVNFKVSLHQMGIAGVTMFLIALSIHFTENYLFEISLFFLINGWVASSRLETKSHSISELFIGFILGVFPQFIILNYWL
ncbi:hypothetical protein OAW63_04055 [Flavobacteriaceae bacterium]|jgi:hypothetical protein|nr:hypothetical protein [Flavobacteriaceae bacterium]MDC6468144.1 hypothetical protein [Flavobacteriaceae bacterium]